MTASEDLERRLEQLEAERAILATLYRYGHAIDYGDEASWVDCFTEDGAFDVRIRLHPELSFRAEGHEALWAFIRSHTRAPDVWHKHVLVEPRVTVDGDRAHVDSYFLKVDAQPEGSSLITAMGRYRDDLVRSADGCWRFVERVAEVDDGPTGPLSVGGS